MLRSQKDWKEFWQLYPVREQNLSLFEEVGKTPITERQFDHLIKDITTLLKPQSDDIVLDVCSGNGVITNQIAKKVQRVVGIDYSVPLIERADKTKEGDNIEYMVYDARDLAELQQNYSGYFTKICCYDALGYFNEKELTKLLSELLPLGNADCLILFGNVLNEDKVFKIYNTFGLKLGYFLSRLTGRGYGLGNWWGPEKLNRVAKKNGLEFKISPQNKLLYTTDHRMDVVMYRTNN